MHISPWHSGIEQEAWDAHSLPLVVIPLWNLAETTQGFYHAYLSGNASNSLRASTTSPQTDSHFITH